MSTSLTSQSFGLPARRYRAASLRQVLALRLQHGAQWAWRVLEAWGRARAQAELYRTAALYQHSRPALAAELKRLAEER